MGAEQSKVAIHQRVHALSESQRSPEDVQFWSPLFSNSFSEHEVFSLISPQNIRKIGAEQPENLCILIFKAIEHIVAFNRLTDFRTIELPDTQVSVQNSLHLLTRLLPIVLDTSSHLFSSFIPRLFWENKFPSTASPIDVIAGEPLASRPLAQVMLDALMDALFKPGFTLPSIIASDRYKKKFASTPSAPQYHGCELGLLYDGGISNTDERSWYHASSVQMDAARTSVLRTLLACNSQTLYTTPDLCRFTTNPFTSYLVSEHCPHNSTLFYSMINTLVHYSPNGLLPYTSYMLDPKESLLSAGLQLLLVLLDYQDPRSSSSPASAEDRTEGNMYVRCMATLSNPHDMALLFKGLDHLLNNPLDTKSTWLPSSLKTISFHQELVIFLWKLLDECQEFRLYVCTRQDINRFLLPVLFVMFNARLEQSKLGMIEVCSFILLLLSGHREFGIALNRTYTRHVPMDLPRFTGSHADLLILVLHKIIVSDRGNKSWIAPLFDCFLTIIANVSPYVKSLSMTAAVKLINLFQAFSTPRFLFSAERNHLLIFLILESFNNLIQYQYEGNINLVAAILRRSSLFTSLASLTLPPITISSSHRIQEREAEEDGRSRRSSGDRIESVGGQSVPSVSEESEDGIPAEAGGASSLSAEHDSGRFIPTPEWVESWKRQLPLGTILRLLDILVPELNSYCSKDGVNSDQEVLNFLKTFTLVGLLPVPHPILIRRYQRIVSTDSFLSAFMWGSIYLKNLSPPLFDARSIRLFKVHVSSSSAPEPEEEPSPSRAAAAAAPPPRANSQVQSSQDNSQQHEEQSLSQAKEEVLQEERGGDSEEYQSL